MKRIILHMGTWKCGSTSIQQRLFDQREALAEAGVLYPVTGCVPEAGHVYLSGTLLRMAYPQPLIWLDLPDNHVQFWKTLSLEIEASPCETVILSSEEFGRIHTPEDVAAMLPVVREYLRPHELHVLAFVRRMDHYFLSWYNQVIKMGGKISLEKYYQGTLERKMYRLFLGDIFDAWTGFFPEARFHFQAFEDALARPGGFMGVLGELAGSGHEAFTRPLERTNPSFDLADTTKIIVRNIVKAALDENGGTDFLALRLTYARHLLGEDDKALRSMDIIGDMREHIRYIDDRYLPGYEATCLRPDLEQSFRKKIEAILEGRRAHDLLLAQLLIAVAQ